MADLDAVLSASKYSSSPETLQRVVELVLEGHSREQAASLAGASLNTVKFWVKRGLIPSRPQGIRVQGRARKPRKRQPSKRIRDPRTRPSVGTIQTNHYLLGDRRLHKQVARLILSTPEETPQELDPADLLLLRSVQEAGPSGISLRDAIALFPRESRRERFHACLHRIIRRARGCCLPCSDVIRVTLRGDDYYYVAGDRIHTLIELATRRVDQESSPTDRRTLSLVEQILRVRRASPQADAYEIAEQLGLTRSLEDQLRFSVALHAAYQSTEQADADPHLDSTNINIAIVRYAEINNGYIPHKNAGDATRYFGFRVNWRSADDHLKRQGTNLREQGLALGFKPKRQPFTLSYSSIDEAIRLYMRDHDGRGPIYRTGDATAYFGYKITWQSVGNYLYRHGSSLLERRIKLGACNGKP